MEMYDKLRILRTNMGLRQVDVARLINVSESTYQKWEKGKNTPSAEDLKHIGKLYNTTLDFLCDENGYVHDCNYTYDLIECDPIYGIGIYYGDTDIHVYDIGLRGHAKLYRCVNRGGCEYSAILLRGMEVMSCPREREKNMVFFWNNECTID